MIESGATVEIMDAGKWVGPYTVTDIEGRTPNHLVLSGPYGKFELYNDAPFNIRTIK